jgi:hypothetical protein
MAGGGYDFYETTTEPADLDAMLFDEPPTIAELVAALKAGAQAIRVVGIVSGSARRRLQPPPAETRVS